MKSRRPALYIISISTILFQLFVYHAHAQDFEIPYSHSSNLEAGIETQGFDCIELRTSIKLKSDVDCIDVLAGGTTSITIDLNQHTVRGGGITGPWLVGSSSKYNVVIKNGVVIGGIVMESATVWLDRIVVKDTEGFAVDIGGGKITRSLFTNNGVAIDLYWGHGFTTVIRDSVFTKNSIAINIAQHNGTRIIRNHFSDNETAIRVWDEEEYGSSDALIDKNAFYANNIGVFLWAFRAADGTSIKNNVLSIIDLQVSP